MESRNFREFVAKSVKGLSYLTGYWGQRFIGTVGLVGDLIAEGGRQAFYQRLPGHPEQAPDSLLQTGRDRDLWRFRGESLTAFAERVAEAWTAYEQAGTDIQVLRVIDQWGTARYPDTWVNETVTLTESSDPEVFEFTVHIPIGFIDPLEFYVYGDPIVYGGPGLVYGFDTDGAFTDLYRLVKKWKPSRSKGFVEVQTGPSVYVTITVA